MTPIESLRENRLLRGCPDEVLARMEPLVAPMDVPPGGVVFRQGDPADAMYLVIDGAIHLTRSVPGGGEEVVARLPKGDFFGDMALLDHEPHIVRAVAAEATVLGRIDRPATEEILRLAPHVVPLNFVRAVHRRVKSMHQHFTDEILRGERLHHVGTMTGSIIHDFKTPLTAIRCACDLLETHDHDAAHRRLAEIIKKSVERMMGMTQELLDYTLGGNAPLQFERVPVERLLAGLDEQCLNDLPRQGIAVERQISYEGDVEVDVARFERVLLNLIKNAHEAMGKKGRLRLAVYASGEEVAFEIEDTGRGMTPEVAAKMFEPFFTHAKPQGTGLGMSMAKSVLDAHRGTIRVTSEPGRGTTFVVRVPGRQG